MHLKEDKKLGRFPFSELKSVHNCARDKLPKMSARQRREKGGGERTAQNHAPGAAIAPILEACPGRNYEPISILKMGIFLTFCPLSNASKIGTAQNKVYGTFKLGGKQTLRKQLEKYQLIPVFHFFHSLPRYSTSIS